jgi:hypothetical protein
VTDHPAPLLLADIVAELEARIADAAANVEESAGIDPECREHYELTGYLAALEDVRHWLLEQA